MSSEAGPTPGLPGRTTAQFAKFLVASAVAAALNFGSRIAFDLLVPYPVAIVLAFCVGLSTAFTLNRIFVFKGSTNALRVQATYFVLINLLGLAQTLLVSLLLARWLLPLVGITEHAESIGHAVGIAVPVVTSFLGHKHVSFRAR